MSTKSRDVLFSSLIAGARIRAEGARRRARQAIREADRAEAETWSIRMEGHGGPAQPSPTIAQCLNGGYGWLQIQCHQCHRCETEASIPLDCVRRPRDTPIWKLEASLKCRSCRKGALRSAGTHDQVDGRAADLALYLGAPGGGALMPIRTDLSYRLAPRCLGGQHGQIVASGTPASTEPNTSSKAWRSAISTSTMVGVRPRPARLVTP